MSVNSYYIYKKDHRNHGEEDGYKMAEFDVELQQVEEALIRKPGKRPGLSRPKMAKSEHKA